MVLFKKTVFAKSDFCNLISELVVRKFYEQLKSNFWKDKLFASRNKWNLRRFKSNFARNNSNFAINNGQQQKTSTSFRQKDFVEILYRNSIQKEKM